MSNEEGMYVAKELLNLSEEVYKSYSRLLGYKFSGNTDNYNKEIDILLNLINSESKYYKKIDDNMILHLLNEMDINDMLSSIENTFDKFINVVYLGFSFNEVSYYRILNLLRDNYIINSRLSRFDDKDLLEDDIDEYNDKMINNIIIENQLFNDFISLFVANLNDYINNIDNFKTKKNLITYKYVVAFTFGKNNLDLLDDKHILDNTFIYSKYLYDMMIYADREFSYNYDIMKVDYLDKVLYYYLKDYRRCDNESVSIINSCFMKSIIMLYQEDYKRVNKIYDSEIRVNDKIMDEIVDNSKKIASRAKVLTLNK